MKTLRERKVINRSVESYGKNVKREENCNGLALNVIQAIFNFLNKFD